MLYTPHSFLGIVLVAVAVGFIVSQMAIFVTTVWLHRGLTHRALTVRRPATLVFRTFIWMSTGIKPRQWVAVHRRHHAGSDTEVDPHSPKVLGYWKVQLTNAWLYRKAARDGITVDKYSRDLPPDRLDRFVFDRAFVGLGIGIVILCLAFGWITGVIAAVLHLYFYIGLSGAINAIGHTRGKRPADNLATNNQWLAWITGGEGLHNNHHARATAPRFAFRRFEIDPGWWLVRSLMAMNQLVLREPASVSAPVAV